MAISIGHVLYAGSVGRRGAVVAMLVALVTTLATASAASAASLVFVRAGDLFAVNADGSQLRIVANGPEAFASPSVAADGSVWAINGRAIVQVSATGAGPARHRAPAGRRARRPRPLAGRRRAWRSSCRATAAPGVYVVSTADGTVAPKSYPASYGPPGSPTASCSCTGPSTAPGGAAALVANIAAATDRLLWFADAASLPTDGDVSADFTLGVWTNGGAGIVIRQLAGAPPAQPTGATCSFTLAAIGPVVQPNAHAVAFTSDDGIWLAPQPEPGACGDAVRILSATEVRDVAWSPLDLAPGAAAPLRRRQGAPHRASRSRRSPSRPRPARR